VRVIGGLVGTQVCSLHGQWRATPIQLSSLKWQVSQFLRLLTKCPPVNATKNPTPREIFRRRHWVNARPSSIHQPTATFLCGKILVAWCRPTEPVEAPAQAMQIRITCLHRLAALNHLDCRCTEA